MWTFPHTEASAGLLVENKKMMIADIPTSGQQKEYMPKGLVDLNLEWISPDKVIVARAKAKKERKEVPVPTMFTALYAINIKIEVQKQISFPKKNELDKDPQEVGSYLTMASKGGKGKD